jgi:hypothetical protein
VEPVADLAAEVVRKEAELADCKPREARIHAELPTAFPKSSGIDLSIGSIGDP